MKQLRTAILAGLAALALPQTAVAQEVPTTASAADPEGIVRLLRFAGYPAELTTDSVGDPMIRTEFSGLTATVLFFGCDERTHRRCDSVQLRVGLDRERPMSPAAVNAEFGNDRYYSVHLDDEGDPWFNWDIVTGNGAGIPSEVFMMAVNRFASQVESASDVVFAEERAR